jgi:hypothetical protein
VYDVGNSTHHFTGLFSGLRIDKLVSFIADSSSLLFLQRSMNLNYPTRPEKRTTNLNVAYFLGESVNFRLGLL